MTCVVVERWFVCCSRQGVVYFKSNLLVWLYDILKYLAIDFLNTLLFIADLRVICVTLFVLYSVGFMDIV